MNDEASRNLATLIRAACVRAALEGYERAQMDGLCHEGAWECAIEAMRALDLGPVIEKLHVPHAYRLKDDQ